MPGNEQEFDGIVDRLMTVRTFCSAREVKMDNFENFIRDRERRRIQVWEMDLESTKPKRNRPGNFVAHSKVHFGDWRN